MNTRAPATLNVEASLREIGMCMSYMTYFATGEGLRSCLSVAGSTHRCELLMKEKLPEYFWPAIVTVPIADDLDDRVARLLERVPVQVVTALMQMPRGAGEYYSEFYYNLS